VLDFTSALRSTLAISSQAFLSTSGSISTAYRLRSSASVGGSFERSALSRSSPLPPVQFAEYSREMSQEDVEVVKVAYEAFARGGLDRFMEHFTGDVDYRAVETAPDDQGPIAGKDAFRAWLQDWIEMFDEFKMEPLELIDAGEDTVVVAEHYGGRAKLSGIDVHSTVWTVLTIRDGKMARGREYLSREQALEAVGLQE
jgi:ketosteroid isomerase-like protein